MKADESMKNHNRGSNANTSKSKKLAKAARLRWKKRGSKQR